jgi:SAM-dependent methyltransferase
MDEVGRENLAYWNEAVAIHLASPFYRTVDFRRGEVVLDPVVREGLGDVAGKRILHLQCHFGLDTLSLARLGAEATGLDYSPPAIEAARALSSETGVPGEFVLADVMDPPPGLTGFDIVFASWGVLCWHRDVAAWMRVAARALKPGGRLYLADGHPAMQMMDDGREVGASSPICMRHPYDSSEPILDQDQRDYAEPEAPITARCTGVWIHGLGSILNAAIDAGFVIRRLDEGDRIPWRALPQLIEAGDGYWTLPPGAPFLPLSFMLDAVLPG